MAFIDCHFFSDSIGLSTAMYVLLPQQTSGQVGMQGKGGGERYPTLYLLHGLSDDHTIWLRRTSIERYVADKGIAVVMPAVHRSFYQDMASGPKYWTFVSEELPRVAQSFFPLSGRREDTFVAGLSMGGYGAFRLGLGCPDRFAAAASLSGALDAQARCDLSKAEGEFRAELASVFGPDLAVAGTEADLFMLADRVARSDGPKPKLYQYCGTEDFLYEDNLRFRDHARQLGLDLSYGEDDGDHQWMYWDARIRAVLEWLPIER